MSEQNVELHRHLMQALNAPEAEALVALCHPSIEFHSTMGVGGAVYHGHDGLRRWHQNIEDAWGDEFQREAEAYFDLGEHTLAFSALRGRGRQSRAEIAIPAAQVCRWRDGLCIYFKGYLEREDALKDLDVSEDELEPIAP
jgi:hypothetical protein